MHVSSLRGWLAALALVAAAPAWAQPGAGAPAPLAKPVAPSADPAIAHEKYALPNGLEIGRAHV